MNDAGTERAFATFKTNVKRASYFLDIHEKIQKGPGSPPKANRELPREALVFVVGALDTFLGDWSASVIIEGMRKGSSHGNAKTVLEQVQKRIPTLSLEVALISDEESRITYIDEAITKYFYSQTSQHGAKAVSAAVDLSGNAPGRSGKQSSPRVVTTRIHGSIPGPTSGTA